MVVTMDEVVRFQQQIEGFRSRIADYQQLIDKAQELPQAVVSNLLSDLMESLEALNTDERDTRVQPETVIQTQTQLEQERQGFHELFEFAPDCYLVTDLHGVILSANRAAVVLLNLESIHLIGQPLTVFIAAKDQQTFRLKIAAMRNASTQNLFELQLVPHQEQSPLSAAITTSLKVDTSGKPAAIYWSIRDMSEHKKLEEELRVLNIHLENRVAERTLRLEALNREKDELLVREQEARRAAEEANEGRLKFLAMISHELRTPLTSIKGFASTLLASDVTWNAERWETFVTVIDEEADKLTELIEHLLDLSRLQAGNLRITLVPVSIPEIISFAVQQLVPITQEHELDFDVPAELPLVLADKSRIAQILTNLVSNAVKYSPPNTQISLGVSTHDESVVVRVADQGAGIPDTVKDQVFEPFFQIPQADNHYMGVGLGLTICRGLVEEHGGRIWVEDQPEHGTTIAFTLPFANYAMHGTSRFPSV